MGVVHDNHKIRNDLYNKKKVNIHVTQDTSVHCSSLHPHKEFLSLNKKQEF